MKLPGSFNFFLLCLLMLCGGTAKAQKEVLYDQYIENPMAINPAFTGVRQDFNLNLMLRRRWFSIPSAPVTQTLASDGTIAQGRVGLGFSALNDRMSPFATTGFYGSSSYIHRTASGWKFSAGIQGGINVLPVYGAGFSGRKVMGSFGAGVWAQSDHFHLGISKPELLTREYATAQTVWDYKTPLYITTGGTIPLDAHLTAVPNITITIDNSYKTETHFGSRLWYRQQIGIGAFYRIGDINRLHLTAEVQFGKNIRIGYLYDSRTIESRFTTIGTGPQGMHGLLFKFIPNPTAFSYH